MKKLLSIVLLTGIVLSSTHAIFAEITNKNTTTKESSVDKRKAYLRAKIADNISIQERKNCVDELNALCSGKTMQATLIKYRKPLIVAGAFLAGLIMLKGSVALNAYTDANKLPETKQDHMMLTNDTMCPTTSPSTFPQENKCLSDQLPVKNPVTQRDALFNQASKCLSKETSNPENTDGLFWSRTKNCIKPAQKYFQKNNMKDDEKILLDMAAQYKARLLNNLALFPKK